MMLRFVFELKKHRRKTVRYFASSFFYDKKIKIGQRCVLGITSVQAVPLADFLFTLNCKSFDEEEVFWSHRKTD